MAGCYIDVGGWSRLLVEYALDIGRWPHLESSIVRSTNLLTENGRQLANDQATLLERGCSSSSLSRKKLVQLDRCQAISVESDLSVGQVH